MRRWSNARKNEEGLNYILREEMISLYFAILKISKLCFRLVRKHEKKSLCCILETHIYEGVELFLFSGKLSKLIFSGL